MAQSNSSNNRKKLLRDLLILAMSISVAILITQAEFLNILIGGGGSDGAGPFESFFAGMFFTSAFTTAPAIVILGKLAQSGDLAMVAIFGAMGAVFGDFILFKFIRDRLGEDLKAVFGVKPSRRFRHIFRTKVFRWLSPFLSVAIIASPLPDELGLAILGLTRVRTSLFVPLSFVANLVGILAIGLVARAI